jgi:hypothetical protein
MITDRNQVCFAKMSVCGVQEEVLFLFKSCRSQGYFNAFTSLHSEISLRANNYW